MTRGDFATSHWVANGASCHHKSHPRPTASSQPIFTNDHSVRKKRDIRSMTSHSTKSRSKFHHGPPARHRHRVRCQVAHGPVSAMLVRPRPDTRDIHMQLISTVEYIAHMSIAVRSIASECHSPADCKQTHWGCRPGLPCQFSVNSILIWGVFKPSEVGRWLGRVATGAAWREARANSVPST